jgi:hypothetical protein
MSGKTLPAFVSTAIKRSSITKKLTMYRFICTRDVINKFEESEIYIIANQKRNKVNDSPF